MTGYNHQAGMSTNAVEAYAAGIKPITRITRRDLDAAGLDTCPVALARWLARQGRWTTTEWHHSGGTWYNRVDFFDPTELAGMVEDGTLDLEAPPRAWKDATVRTNGPGVRVVGTYARFGGSRRRPQYLGDESFTGTLDGAWIRLDDGGRKRADGRHITWRAL